MPTTEEEFYDVAAVSYTHLAMLSKVIHLTGEVIDRRGDVADYGSAGSEQKQQGNA